MLLNYLRVFVAGDGFVGRSVRVCLYVNVYMCVGMSVYVCVCRCMSVCRCMCADAMTCNYFACVC